MGCTTPLTVSLLLSCVVEVWLWHSVPRSTGAWSCVIPALRRAAASSWTKRRRTFTAPSTPAWAL
eukprot:8497418-Alexandrium_andersonii.AAC.1